MSSQMDVFLQTETQSFVEMLFKIVDTKEYLAANQTQPVVVKTETDLPKEEDSTAAAGDTGYSLR